MVTDPTPKLLIHEINDVSDAVADAKAMVWAVFHIAQSLENDEVGEALSACANQALSRLLAAARQLESIATGERVKEGL